MILKEGKGRGKAHLHALATDRIGGRIALDGGSVAQQGKDRILELVRVVQVQRVAHRSNRGFVRCRDRERFSFRSFVNLTWMSSHSALEATPFWRPGPFPNKGLGH